jgi:chromosome segregation ATPase
MINLVQWNTKSKTYLLLSVLLVSFLLLFSPVGSCSSPEEQQQTQEQTLTITETQLNQLGDHLAQLAENNRQLLMQLDESNQDLALANESSVNLARESERLRQELTESQKKIEELTNQLDQLKKETGQLKSSLTIANEELANASKLFKTYEMQRDRRERILTNQRNFWEVIGGLAIGGCAYLAATR